MGSAQSTFSNPESVIAGALVAGSAAAYYVYGSSKPGSNSATPKASQPKASGSKKGNKKGADTSDFDEILAEAAASAREPPAMQSHVVSFPDVVPGTFESEKDYSHDLGSTTKAKKTQKKKKGKKPQTTAAQSEDTSAPEPDPVPTPIATDVLAEAEVSVPTKKDKKKKGKKVAITQASALPTSVAGPSSKAGTPPQIADEGPWTRVEARPRGARRGDPMANSASDAGLTTSVTETSEKTDDDGDDDASSSGSAGAQKMQQEDRRRTFVEKMLPKQRKTGLEDMLETPMYPTLSRVIRVPPGPNDKPPQGYSWDDYEDVAHGGTRGSMDVSTSGDDDGSWGVVRNRKRTNLERKPSSSQHPTTAPETLTKRQRQNAAKREAQKADKEAAEAERRRVLAQHKREVERVKMDEQFKKAGSKVGGGMQASVNESGFLVYE